MPKETDTSASPYFDDFDPNKDFHSILFKPGVSVQVRELNQLQTILQQQIERFGDNVYKRGTIIDGCNFAFIPSMPYVKIKDSTVAGDASLPSNYLKYFVRNEASNLTAYIVDYADGFESSDPDLKTLFLTYRNSGTGNTFAFSPSDFLKITDANTGLHKISVIEGSSGFSNDNVVVITPAIVVNVTSGAFTNGMYINNGGEANVQIVEIDEVTRASKNQVIFRVQPRDVDLANSSVTRRSWLLSNTESIIDSSAAATGTIEAILGTGASAAIQTDAIGTITDVTVRTRGGNYKTNPTVRVRSYDNEIGLGTLELSPQNYVAEVQVADVADAVGNGYGFSVSDGIIYQKGYFVRVGKQTIIVDKYSSAPNAVAVGFMTNESIITSTMDDSLLDPVIGTGNRNAPGADRLKLTANLVVVSSSVADSNTDFFTLAEWSEGQPYKINQVTQFNRIEDAMAVRTVEESGDYVVDRFNVTTRSPLEPTEEGNVFSVIIDPGVAYIDGYRVETNRNYSVDVEKGLDTINSSSSRVSLYYGNYIRIAEVGGVFQFSTGDRVQLRNATKQFISNVAHSSIGNTDPAGGILGFARMRSLIHEDGSPGSNSAIYRLYLFDIEMQPGRNFRDVKSIYYNGSSNKGVADLVLEQDGTTGANIAVVRDKNVSKLLFNSGARTLLNAANVTYQYRTLDQTVQVSNNGILVKDISGTSDEFFPYSGSMVDNDLKKLYVVPTGASLIAANNLTGNVAASTTTANLVGNGTTFLTHLRKGDFVYLLANSTGGADTRQVQRVVNNTLVILDSNVAFSNATAKIRRIFPKNAPVPFGSRTGLSAAVTSNSNILTMNFGFNFDTASNTAMALAVDISRVNPTPVSKSAARKQFVRLRMANNAATTVGPWCLGLPDIFRLRGVYLGTSSGVANTNSNVVDNFYVDHNQNPNYLNLSFLYKKPDSKLRLTSSNWLLVEFDYFTQTGSGFADLVSYIGANAAQIVATDSLPLSDLTSEVNTFEVPEVYDQAGATFDLKRFYDFRPRVSNTATPTATYGSSTINPAYALAFGDTGDPTNDKKFPNPESVFVADIEQFAGRTDRVVIDRQGQFSVLKGRRGLGANPPAPTAPDGTMVLNDIRVPPYPGLPLGYSNNVSEILNQRVANEKFSRDRFTDRQIRPVRSEVDIQKAQPRRYTMQDIGSIDRRLQSVEFYTALTLMESDARRRVIPSSLDPSLDRFKFGFFVDDFRNYKFSDTNNPQYSAQIVKDDVVPNMYFWNIPGGNVDVGFPYRDHLIIQQPHATVRPDGNDHVNCIPNTAYTNAHLYVVVNKGSPPFSPLDIRVEQVTMTSPPTSAPVTLYMYNFQPVRYEVWQGTTRIRHTAQAAALTAADKLFMKSDTWPASLFTAGGINLDTPFENSNITFNPPVQPPPYSATGTFTKYGAKLTWTHNPANGREYTIVTFGSLQGLGHRWALQYPIDNSDLGCPEPPANGGIYYTGTLTVNPNPIRMGYTRTDDQDSGGLP